MRLAAHEPTDVRDLLRCGLAYLPSNAVVAINIAESQLDGTSVIEPALLVLSNRMDAVLTDLSRHSRIFWPLANENILQILGPQILGAPPFRVVPDVSTVLTQRGKGCLGASSSRGLMRDGLAQQLSNVLATGRSCSILPGIKFAEGQNSAHSTLQRTRRARLSSWRRHILRRHRAMAWEGSSTLASSVNPCAPLATPRSYSREGAGFVESVPDDRGDLTSATDDATPSHLQRLIASHRRCSYHMLLRRHLTRRPAANGGGAEWREMRAFIWAVCATLLPNGRAARRSRMRTMVRDVCRTMLADGLLSKIVAIPLASEVLFCPDRSYVQCTTPSPPVVATSWQLGLGSQGRGAACHHTHRRQLRSTSAWLISRVLLASIRRLVVARSPLRHPEPSQSDVWPRGYWKSTTRRHCRRVKDASLHPLDSIHATAVLTADGRELGASALSVVPKGNGAFRTINNLKLAAHAHESPHLHAHAHAVHVPPMVQSSINSSLAHLSPLMSRLHSALPSALATSLLGLSEAHIRWRIFVAERRHNAPNSLLCLRTADFVGCYDTLTQPRLFQTISFTLQLLEDATSLHKRFAVYRANSQAQGGIARSLARLQSTQQVAAVAARSRCSATSATASTMVGGGRCRTASVFCEKELASGLAREGALRLLRQHVFSHVVKTDGKYYASRMGLPQGSVLSTWLCSLHLAAAEHAVIARYLPVLTKHMAALKPPAVDAAVVPSQLQLRIIDDTLDVRVDGVDNKILTRQQSAFGCIQNVAKSLQTITDGQAEDVECKEDSVHGNGEAPGVSSSGAEGASSTNACSIGRPLHPWCGWLVDANTLELRLDFSRGRTAAARDRRSRWTRDGTAACTRPCFLRALVRALRPRLHAGFLDPQLNSSLLTRRNTHHAFLHALLAARADAHHGSPISQTATFQVCIALAATFVRRQQKRSIKLSPQGKASSTLLADCEVAYLGWAAIASLAHHRAATLGRCVIRKTIEIQLCAAQRRCAALSAETLPLLALACSATGLVT